MKERILICLFLFSFISSYSQVNTIRGYAYSSKGEPLIEAYIYSNNFKYTTSTNDEGYYYLQLSEGEKIDTLLASFVGYEQGAIRINEDSLINNSGILNFYLKTKSFDELIISSSKSKYLPNTSEVGTVKIPIEILKSIPTIGGEKDLIKALALTPGVQSGTEASAGLYIRGSTSDQNLILLDEAVVYNANHLFGMVSVFNPDVIKDVKLWKGVSPAKYGGRLSSVLSIRTKEGESRKFKGGIGIGLISSKAYLEGGIKKHSFVVSARSSYLDLLTLAFRKYNQNKNPFEASFLKYRMYDLNAKLNFKLNDTDQLYFSFYRGSDFFSFTEKQKINNIEELEQKLGIEWGNITFTTRYNKPIGKSSFWKNMILFSNFNYKFTDAVNEKTNAEVSDFTFQTSSKLSDLQLKSEIEYKYNNKHEFCFGINSTLHFFSPQKQTQISTISEPRILNQQKITSPEVAIYGEDVINLNKKITLSIGLRTNTIFTKEKAYASLEPRFVFSYDLGRDKYMKVAWGRTQQFVHQLTNSSQGFQNDLWVPSTNNIPPEKGWQSSIGFEKLISQKNIFISFELYYKKLHSLIDYSKGFTLENSIDKSWEELVETNGEGKAYGAEFFVKKDFGKLSGFIAYTLAWNERRFENINGNKWYFHKYDARNTFNIVLQYSLSKKWKISSVFNIRSGYKSTIPEGYVILPTDKYRSVLYYYSSKNNYQLPLYHRLDLAFIYKKENRKKRIHQIDFGAYNVYNRKNVSNALFVSVLYSNKFYVKEETLLPVVPYINYAYSF